MKFDYSLIEDRNIFIKEGLISMNYTICQADPEKETLFDIFFLNETSDVLCYENN